MLSDDFFVERDSEIESWAARGFVELGDLLENTDYEPEDLVRLGVLVYLEITCSTHLHSFVPTDAWSSRFSEGRYQTYFLPATERDALLILLAESRK